MAQVGAPTLRKTTFQLIPYCSLSHHELSGRFPSGNRMPTASVEGPPITRRSGSGFGTVSWPGARRPSSILNAEHARRLSSLFPGSSPVDTFCCRAAG
jgi:hypothetical protein